jgi:hypothetical protein
MPACLRFEASEFQDGFGNTPFRFEHELAESSLFAQARVERLFADLPATAVRVHRGNVPEATHPLACLRHDLSPTEAIRSLHREPLWIYATQIERDPGYRALLHRCIEEIRPHSESIAPGLFNPQAFLIVSSPHALRPYHVDATHNFLIHIRGEKTAHVWDPFDRETLSEMELEHTFSETQKLNFQESYRERAFERTLSPGQGIHLPVMAPHFVRNGPEACVSLTIAFRTPCSVRRQTLYRINGNLRRLGMHPTPVGAKKRSDALKYATYQVVRRAKNLMRGRG